MFIAINAKADVSGSKKGKLTPAQNAQVNAWCLSSKTGIFDCLGRCEATSTSYSAISNEAIVDFHNGYIVICGRLIECEEGSTVKIVTPLSGSIDGKIILRYDLNNSGENEFVVTTTTAALVQQDLNENPITGVYEFELYSYTATPTNVTLVRNNTDYIPDIGGKLSQFMSEITSEINSIEQRLTDLGFKRGSVMMAVGTASSQNIRRQGNYCLFNLTATVDIRIEKSTTINLAQLSSSEFYPTSEITSYVKYTYGGGSSGTGYAKVTLTTGGGVKLSEFSVVSGAGDAVQATGIKISNVGYQANPIT